MADQALQSCESLMIDRECFYVLALGIDERSFGIEHVDIVGQALFKCLEGCVIDRSGGRKCRVPQGDDFVVGAGQPLVIGYQQGSDPNLGVVLLRRRISIARSTRR